MCGLDFSCSEFRLQKQNHHELNFLLLLASLFQLTAVDLELLILLNDLAKCMLLIAISYTELFSIPFVFGKNEHRNYT